MQVTRSKNQAGYDLPAEIWLAGIDPNQPFYRKISNDAPVNRKDPEIFITKNGPYAYVLRNTTQGDPLIFRLEKGLGPRGN